MTDDRERTPNPPVAGPHLLWHYTTAVALPAILEAGELRPAGEARGEHPAVWFTTRGDWETGASMGVYRIPGFGEVRELEAGLRAEHGDAVGDAFLLAVARVLAPWFVAGLVRIGIRPCSAPYTWDDFKRVSGGPDASWADVEADDLRRGCDNREWRVSFDPVPASRWIAVEVRSGVGPGERWEPINPTCWRGET